MLYAPLLQTALGKLCHKGNPRRPLSRQRQLQHQPRRKVPLNNKAILNSAIQQ